MTNDRLQARVTRWVAYGGAVLVPVILGASLYPARGHVVPANLALLFVVCTVGIASMGLRGPAVVAALSSGLSFDYFCTTPYLTLRMSRAQDVTTTLLLLVVGLLVGQVAAMGRQARTRAKTSSDRLRRIYLLSEQMATGSEPAFLIAAVATELRDLLILRDCRFTDRPSLDVHTRIMGDGSVAIGTLTWDADRLGLPTRQVSLPVRSAGTMVGAFILTPTPAVPVELERRVTAVALADELGATLTVGSLAG
jgi:K+-sensing histidine kinase KdpD